MELLSSPSYHFISPLTRSRSDVRYPAMKRSSSFSGSGSLMYSPSTTRFSRPSYGYGGGYMARSLSRSGSSLFGRSLAATALTRTPPLHNVGVQRSTPHFTDKYPYVRYSYGNTDTALGIVTQSESVYSRHSAIQDIGTKRWLEGKLTSYSPSQFQRSEYRSTIERAIKPQRTYIRYMPVDDAVDMYKKKCMTVGTLSKLGFGRCLHVIRDFCPFGPVPTCSLRSMKRPVQRPVAEASYRMQAPPKRGAIVYWLSPATWASRREKELNLSSSLSRGTYSYANRYNRFSSRLY